MSGPVAGGTDLVALRGIVETATSDLGDVNTHATLPEACALLGLPAPPTDGSKHTRVTESVVALPDARLPEVARNLLAGHRLDARTRNALQDALWVGENHPLIPKRRRRDIALDLDLADLVRRADKFLALLDRLWVLDDDPLAWVGTDKSLGALIDRHVFRNPGDWSTEELFDHLGVFEASDRRCALFLEALVSADVVPDEAAQRRLAETMNRHLGAVGVELRESDVDGGYPVFAVFSTRAGRRRPKNLIFASTEKPDIRLSDVIDSEIEIVGNADKVLVYDRPIGADGIRWSDLQTWWQDTHALCEDEAKAALYVRLRESVKAAKSPPQLLLFDLYHDICGALMSDPPALLPEIWLHWDPKTVHTRGVDALLKFRMDFLLLLPHGRRVVLEVDGPTHYAVDGRADPAAYARNMRADRDLKLAGYEVFRFGTHDLRTPQQAGPMVRQFFEDLFTAFGVPTT